MTAKEHKWSLSYGDCALLWRGGLSFVTTDASGNGSLTLDLTQPPFTGPNAPITPLSSWNVQFWYRDLAGGPSGFKFSNGLNIVFCQ